MQASIEKLLAYAHLSSVLKEKTILSLKAVSDIYLRTVRQVCSEEEDQEIERIKEKIQERIHILQKHSQSSKDRIAQNSKSLFRDGMVSREAL